MSRSSKEIIEGSMLGDGALACPCYSTHYYLSYSGLLHCDCMRDIARVFASEGIPVSKGYPRPEKAISRGKTYDRITLCTKSCELLTERYHKWYSSGVKEVPVGIKLTPPTLAQWYMDGGYAGGTKSKTLAVSIRVYSFSWESVGMLEEKLYGLGVLVYPSIDHNVKTGSGVRLRLRQESINSFMDIVEPCMYQSFRNKIMRRSYEDYS